MSRIKQLADEIMELRRQRTRRSAIYIHGILENNRKLFLEHIGQQNLDFATKNFEMLADAGASDYQSQRYPEDYERAFESLAFHLNRII